MGGGGQDRHQVRSQAKRKEPGKAEGRWKQTERKQNVRQAARSLAGLKSNGPG